MSGETRSLETTTVFIDTCVFRNANFCLNNSTFSQFRKLCREGHFEFVTTDITKQEISRRIAEQALDAYNGIERFKDKTRLLGALHRSFGSEYKSLTKSVIQNTLTAAVKRFFTSCLCKTLLVPPLAVPHVFKKYFAQEKPFEGGKKKSEFPDAFVIESLLSLKKKVYVISVDGGFSGAHANLIVLRDLGELLHIYNSSASQTAEYVRKLILGKHRPRILRALEAELSRIPVHGVSGTHCTVRVTDFDAWVVAFRPHNAKVALDVTCVISGQPSPSIGRYDFGYDEFEQEEEFSAQMDVAFDLKDDSYFSLFNLKMNELQKFTVDLD